MDDSDEYYGLDEYRICPKCNQPNIGQLGYECMWCKKYEPGKFLKGQTSGIPEIDKLIYESQLKAENDFDDFYGELEWIPYDRLQNIKPIGKGGFASVFSATWLDGEPTLHGKYKERTDPVTVALKKFKNSVMEVFINEVKT